jgi:hypothetical protein
MFHKNVKVQICFIHLGKNSGTSFTVFNFLLKKVKKILQYTDHMSSGAYFLGYTSSLNGVTYFLMSIISLLVIKIPSFLKAHSAHA